MHVLQHIAQCKKGCIYESGKLVALSREVLRAKKHCLCRMCSEDKIHSLVADSLVDLLRGCLLLAQQLLERAVGGADICCHLSAV